MILITRRIVLKSRSLSFVDPSLDIHTLVPYHDNPTNGRDDFCEKFSFLGIFVARAGHKERATLRNYC